MEAVNTLLVLVTLLLGGAGGAALAFWWRRKTAPPTTTVRQDSAVLMERIEKVFKVVMAEGYFSEILSYQDDKKILYFINDPKKALIIAKSKVLVGFDFAKVRFRQPDNGEKRLIVEHFPEPEVLSIDTDYQFYNIEPGYINHFTTDDYTQLLDEAKQTMLNQALKSDLPRIANNQIQYMMYQLADSMGWQFELPEAEQRKLTELTHQYDSLKAAPKALPGNTLEEE